MAAQLNISGKEKRLSFFKKIIKTCVVFFQARHETKGITVAEYLEMKKYLKSN